MILIFSYFLKLHTAATITAAIPTPDPFPDFSDITRPYPDNEEDFDDE